MEEKKEKSAIAVRPSPESTPLKFWRNPENDSTSVVVNTVKDRGEVSFNDSLKTVVGVKDTELAKHIFHSGANAIAPLVGEINGMNTVAQSLHDFKPQDAMEARLAVQAEVLFAHGLSNLRRSETAEMVDHANHYGNRALKLLRMHNETVDALNRYRRGGEQKVTVTHAVLAGQAIVNNFSGGGGDTQSQGGSSCSQRNAGQQQEPTSIGHVGSQQWQTEGADCTEGKVQGRRRKKVCCD